MNNIIGILIALRILALISLGITVYQLFAYINGLNVIREGFNKIYLGIKDITVSRLSEKQAYEVLYGNHLSSNRIIVLEEKLRYSGILRKYRFLSTELFIIFIIGNMSAVFLITLIITCSLLVSAILALCMYMVIIAVLNKMCVLQNQRCGEQMITFVNLVANYAAVTDDIINILDKTAYEMREPLRSPLLECCESARRSGDTSRALKKLETSIEYPFFKTIIRNLELASRSEANYNDIMNECREMLQNNLENEKELARIYRNGNAEIVGTIIAGILCIYALAAGVLRMSMSRLLEYMMSNSLGIIIIAYTIVVVGLGLYHVFITRGGK